MNFLRFLSSGTNLLNFSFSNPTVPSSNQALFEESHPHHPHSQQPHPQIKHTPPSTMPPNSNTSSRNLNAMESGATGGISMGLPMYYEHMGGGTMSIPITSATMKTSKSLEQLLIKQQQELLNECIKLNLELIGNNPNPNPPPVPISLPASTLHPPLPPATNLPPTQPTPTNLLLKKRIKKVNRCQHTDKKHYAKGLCNNCYHRYGRSKRPWNCKHEVLYAAGMCQNCYINRYNKMRRDQQKREMEGDGEESEMVVEEQGEEQGEEERQERQPEQERGEQVKRERQIERDRKREIEISKQIQKELSQQANPLENQPESQ